LTFGEAAARIERAVAANATFRIPAAAHFAASSENLQPAHKPGPFHASIVEHICSIIKPI
jgi:hypothetical protein